MVKHAEGEGLWRRGGGLIYFCGGDKGANFVFRVMGAITSDRKHFSNTDPLCIAPTQYVCVCGGGGGGGE